VDRVALDVLGASPGPLSAIGANCLRLVRLRRAMLGARPDAVVSFGDSTNCLTLLAAAGTGLRVIVSERSDPRRLHLGRAWAALRRRLYPHASAVVVQTERVASWARGFVPEQRVHVIPNFVRMPEIEPDSAAPLDGTRQVAAAGRLFSAEKGFDLLLSAFARCAPRHPEWSLAIAGEGRDRAQLEAQAAASGLADRVRLPGLVRDTNSFLARSDLFVLSSRFEGFPNALLEAMALGVAPLAFDCNSGPAEIIRANVDGVLVPPEDVDALAHEMDRLMGDDEERSRLGRAARAVTLRFGLSEVMQKWELLTDDCSGRAPLASGIRAAAR
jgi:glycosyltransferase involved in cell wall biosynthesis